MTLCPLCGHPLQPSEVVVMLDFREVVEREGKAALGASEAKAVHVRCIDRQGQGHQILKLGQLLQRLTTLVEGLLERETARAWDGR